MEPTLPSDNQKSNLASNEDKGKQRVRKKIRKKRDPLDEKVKKYRRKREHATIKRQKVERFMLAVAGIIIVIFLINIILAVTSEVNLNWLTWIVVSIGVIGFIIWGFLKTSEAMTIKAYQKNRRKQKLRDIEKKD